MNTNALTPLGNNRRVGWDISMSLHVHWLQKPPGVDTLLINGLDNIRLSSVHLLINIFCNETKEKVLMKLACMLNYMMENKSIFMMIVCMHCMSMSFLIQRFLFLTLSPLLTTIVLMRPVWTRSGSIKLIQGLKLVVIR